MATLIKATNRNAHKRKQPQNEAATNLNGHKPCRKPKRSQTGQTETATKWKDHKPKGHKPKRSRRLAPDYTRQN